MTTILTKKKDTAGAPAPGDLTNAAGGAEIAVNTATKRIYTKDSGGNVVEVGTNPTATTMNGNLTFSPDATYDIGASGATRPRDIFMSRNLTVGGTLTVAGGINFNGNVTIGDSSADTLTVNSTITSNLIFTDNTYDIGASGATRPRTLYLGTSLITPAITNSGLTSGRVVYTTTGGLETSSANLLYSGTDLTVYGITVGRGAGAVATNIAVGTSALAANTIGAYNVAIGRQAMLLNTDGSNNVVVGSNALDANISGVYNTAIGDFSLSASTGSYNTALGADSLRSNTTASNNTAVGYQAAYSNVTGAGLTAIGYQSLQSNTGDFNTAVGRASLNSNTSGGSNAALGYNALINNSTGSNNTGIGMQALNSNTTASNNVAVGYQAGYTNTTSAGNTLIGHQAGYTQNNTSGNAYNTFIGYQAGYGVTTGYGNVFIGVNAGTAAGSGSAVTTGSKNTIIGAYTGNQGGLDIRTASNWIVLSDGDGNPRMTYNATGVPMYVQAAPTSKSTTATLTGAEVLTQILNTTGTTYTVTLPTGTNLDTATGGMPTDTAFDFTVINTASGTITVAVNTGITSLGTLTVATETSASFKIRKTAANTFVIYRM